jgi:hypothetical protein
MPSLPSCSTSLLAPCLVRVNTSTWVQLYGCLIRCDSIGCFLSRSTGWIFCAITSTVELRRATSIMAGLSSRPSASALISSEKVAENSRFWRFGGSAASTLRISRMKPMSSMRSASSRIRISTLRLTVPWVMWSSRRPGVATRMSTPCFSCLICGLMPTPPKITAEFRLQCICRRCARFPRPGPPVRGSGSGSARGSNAARCYWPAAAHLSVDRRCRIGSVKPAVLPVPVWAPASRSPPLQHGRNGLGLDRGRRGVTGFGNGAHDGFGQAELGKGHNDLYRRSARCARRHVAQRVSITVIIGIYFATAIKKEALGLLFCNKVTGAPKKFVLCKLCQESHHLPEDFRAAGDDVAGFTCGSLRR